MILKWFEESQPKIVKALIKVNQQFKYRLHWPKVLPDHPMKREPKGTRDGKRWCECNPNVQAVGTGIVSACSSTPKTKLECLKPKAEFSAYSTRYSRLCWRVNWNIFYWTCTCMQFFAGLL